MPEHRNPNRRTVYNWTINGGQGGAGGRGQAAGGAGGSGTGPTMSYEITAKSFIGQVTNYNAAPSVPSDFRMIPLADIDLRHEIRVGGDTGLVTHRPRWARARRLYSAKVAGQESSVTVAVYQGNGAEKQWRKDIKKYMSFRHPNVIQVSSAASSGSIHATIFHDDLIPFRLFLHQHSPLLAIYICLHCIPDFKAALSYLDEAGRQLLFATEFTYWIRRSTGRLSVELAESDNSIWLNDPRMSTIEHDWSAKYALGAPEAQMVINSLSIGQYHTICRLLLQPYLHFSIPPSWTVDLGAVCYISSSRLGEDFVEIASLPNATENIHLSLFYWYHQNENLDGELMENGWTRFQSDEVSDDIWLPWLNLDAPQYWLSQANHIFRRLRITSNFEDYIFLEGAQFCLTFSRTAKDVPAGFLFLCPYEEFRIGPSFWRWPDCPAYWSLDSSGVDRLSPEEATRLGFPDFLRVTKIKGYYWDTSVYEGLRRFHEGKGCDPYSQDVARYFSYPLYQLSSEIDPPFAHVEEPNVDPDSDCDTVHAKHDYGSTPTDVDGWADFCYAEEGHLDSPTITEDSRSGSPDILDEQDHSSDSAFRRDTTGLPTIHAVMAASRKDHPSESHAVGYDTVELPTLDQEMPSPSETFKFLMNIKLVLILLLALFGLYDPA